MKGHQCKFISVVRGFWYTLYLVSDESGVSNFRLIFCYKGKTPNPLFVSSAFVGIDPPRNVGNKKISDTVERSEKVTPSSKTILRDATSKSDKKNMANELAAKDEEISRLREEISRMKTSRSKKDEEISRLKEENARLQSSFKELEEKVKKYEGFLSSQKEKTRELTIVDLCDYKEESAIGEGSTSIVKIVLKPEKYAKKELLLFDYKAMQRFLFESEVLFKLRHPCIIRVYDSV